jgi:hypothetical protein
MAVCLQYQSVYVRREARTISAKAQVVAAVAILGVLGARVWAKLEATDLGYQLAQARQQTVELDMERRELELQRSVLMRPDSLAKSAREMVQLSDHSPGKTIKVTY